MTTNGAVARASCGSKTIRRRTKAMTVEHPLEIKQQPSDAPA
jgi:hypothetical protein